MRIDPHVHCRDGKQAYKETISHVFEVAENQGVDIIFDMPNTDPPITTKGAVLERLKLVPEKKKEKYFLWLGLTSDSSQIIDAVEAYNSLDRVIGFKLYAGKSVGDLAVVELWRQLRVYQVLKDMNYRGVLAVHCEREDLMKPSLWDPLRPISHSAVRPKEAEIEAVKDQIRFVRETKFNGILHIVHVSCKESVGLIQEAKHDKIKITCGVTPHHLLFNKEMLAKISDNLYKMNPPLRSSDDRKKLEQCLLNGSIDWIETDHAPHSIGEKLFHPFLSGYPSLYIYRYFVEKFLPDRDVPKQLIDAMTCDNIIRIFGEKLKGLEV